MVYKALEIRRLLPKDADSLGDMFEQMAADGEDKWFHPVPLNREQARIFCEKQPFQDLHYVLADGDLVLGIGLLRGWDEGYKEPRLGIAIHKSIRHMGMGRMFMGFLHKAAKFKGSKSVLLAVYPDNAKAIALYKSIGYEEVEHHNSQIIMKLKL